ncbi:hypothetical protein QL285_023876 [Trifolium repens]|nr:hypothetical protein QL285_023876 [Trifolium repens]
MKWVGSTHHMGQDGDWFVALVSPVEKILLFISGSGREFSCGVKYDLNSRAEFLLFHGLISSSAFKS